MSKQAIQLAELFRQLPLAEKLQLMELMFREIKEQILADRDEENAEPSLEKLLASDSIHLNDFLENVLSPTSSNDNDNQKPLKTLGEAASYLNVGVQTLHEFLFGKGIIVDAKPNQKINTEISDVLKKEFIVSREIKILSESIKLQDNRGELLRYFSKNKNYAKSLKLFNEPKASLHGYGVDEETEIMNALRRGDGDLYGL